MSEIKNANVCKCQQGKLEDIRKSQEIIDRVKNGENISFGLIDMLGSCWGPRSFFPCEFVEVIDYDKGIIKVYEESIDKHHVDLACNMLAEYDTDYYGI